MFTNGKEIPPVVVALGWYLDELYFVMMAASALVGFWRLV